MKRQNALLLVMQAAALDLSLRFAESSSVEEEAVALLGGDEEKSCSLVRIPLAHYRAKLRRRPAARAKTGLAEALATEHFAKVGVHRSLAPALAEGRALSWRHQEC